MWIKTKAPRARLPLAIALLLACWLACWLATGARFDDETQEAYHAERFVADAIPGHNRVIRTRSGVMRVLARDLDIRRTLARFGAAPPPGRRSTSAQNSRRWLSPHGETRGIPSYFVLKAASRSPSCAATALRTAD
jgi:hypothetical protein